jgi:toxin ParE1/3/4
MRCVFSNLAALDLEEIADYIARDNPRRALSFVAEIRDRCQKIVHFPEAVPLRPQFGHGIRIVPFGRYLIFYTVQPGEIRVERVLPGMRNLPDFFDQDD